MIKFIVISDTHNMHNKLGTLPKCNFLIHCGDFTNWGKYDKIKDFMDWFSDQDNAIHKIVIPGNHELTLDPKYNDVNDIVWKMIRSYTNIHFLLESSITLEGINFWGSPYSDGKDWGFHRNTNDEWSHIPTNTDILITHCPPKGILDKNSYGNHLGSEGLLKTVKELKPVYHLFGHIHESYGKYTCFNTHFINASYPLLGSYIEFVL